MAQFSKFMFLFALKLNFNGGLILKINIKIWFFQTVEKVIIKLCHSNLWRAAWAEVLDRYFNHKKPQF